MRASASSTSKKPVPGAPSYLNNTLAVTLVRGTVHSKAEVCQLSFRPVTSAAFSATRLVPTFHSTMMRTVSASQLPLVRKAADTRNVWPESPLSVMLVWTKLPRSGSASTVLAIKTPQREPE